MTDIELAWNLSSPALLGLAAAAIALLLVLIIRARLHAFIALTIVSVATALASGVLPSDLIDVLYDGFGSTLASVALLVGLGAMLGRMLELSGGAEVLTDALIRAFGEKRAPLALGVTSLLFGFPIFFDAGLVVMLPIIFTIARRLGGSLLLYAMPAAMAFSAMHIFVPPHPGPVAASGLLGANVGLVLVCGLIIAIPAWYLTGYLFGLFIGKRIEVSVPRCPSPGARATSSPSFASRPKLSQVVFLLVLPLVLIFANTGLNFAGEGRLGSIPNRFPSASLRLLGETPDRAAHHRRHRHVAARLAAAERSGDGRETSSTPPWDRSARSSSSPGAGGMFGGVLRASGIGDSLCCPGSAGHRRRVSSSPAIVRIAPGFCDRGADHRGRADPADRRRQSGLLEPAGRRHRALAGRRLGLRQSRQRFGISGWSRASSVWTRRRR
jgi:GntP family gluconate:H+ symporter